MQTRVGSLRKSLSCGEVWKGNRCVDLNVSTNGTEMSLYSIPCDANEDPTESVGGGDAYCISVCDWGLLPRIGIADVMGHGKAVSAAGSWMCRSMNDKMNSLEGNEVLVDLNSAAVDHGRDVLATAAVITWDTEDKELHYSYAGHYPVFWRAADADTWRSLKLAEPCTEENLPLGAGKNCRYDQSTAKLSNGDMVFLYTDGVLEAANDEGELYGERRVLDSLNRHDGGPEATKQGMLRDLLAFTGGKLGHDDVTFMVMRVS